MNKEEIDGLENYLKNDLPKIEPNIPITTFGSVDLEDLMDSIKKFKKVPTIDELFRENKKLRHQLEEKDKIIDEAIDYIKNTKNYVFDAKRSKITGELIVNNKIETNTINKIKLLEILERR